jgi:glycosyltransferase involved in cell wall biosynthesis
MPPSGLNLLRNNQLPRLLTFNCHEAWVHQMEYLGYPYDIIDGLPGRYCGQWDLRVRPIPRNSSLLPLDRVLAKRLRYLCIITHNLTDLLDSKTLPGPRILVIHSSLKARMSQHGLGVEPEELRKGVKRYLEWVGGHATAVSLLKGQSWGFSEDIVEFAVDVNQYRPWSGDLAAGLRISNQVLNRREILHWEFHEAAFRDIDIRLVGFNPEIPGVVPSRDWGELKSLLSSHRFYVHTAHPELEDGYNMAALEAMAAGLPVLGNRHPSSPVDHGISGFLSDDPGELNQYARLLLRNKDLAGRMGEAARKKVSECFSMEGFASRFRGSIVKAWRKWENRKAPEVYFSPAKAEPDREITPPSSFPGPH